MVQAQTAAAVIPCLNEGGTIQPLVAAVRRHVRAVIVVDDGSTDSTAALAAQAGALLERHSQNLGKGAALQTGLVRARELGFEWAFTLDGDGQHAAEDLSVLWERRKQTGALLVVGDRMHRAPELSWVRRHVNRFMSHRLSRRAGCALPDSQCGLRLVHLETWGTLPLRARRFEVESEMLLGFVAAGHPIAFAPIRVLPPSRDSHIRPVIDTLRWWRWLRTQSRDAR
jgi:glycosyltransferase involved in cell wall biosynthesis